MGGVVLYGCQMGVMCFDGEVTGALWWWWWTCAWACQACMGVWRRELPEGCQGALNKVYATSIRRPYHGFSPHLAEAEHRQTNNLNLAVKCDNNVQD